MALWVQFPPPTPKGDDMLERSEIALAAFAAALAGCMAEPATNTSSETDSAIATGAAARPILAAGAAHACVLQNGSVYCWGYGLNGQRGDGTRTYQIPSPQLVNGLTNQVSVAANDRNTCSVGADGSVHCWGDNTWGLVGNGATGGIYDTPQRVVWKSFYGNLSPLTSIVEVALSQSSVCARDTSGSMWCWGMGNTPSIASRIPSLTALQVTSNCALRSDHQVSCWQGGSLQLVPFVTNAVEISSSTSVAGDGVDCARISDGTVKCWGRNFYGELGNGRDDFVPTAPGNSPEYTQTQYYPLPTNVLSPNGRTNLANVIALSHSASGNTMCAILANGTTYCWGANDYAQTGNGTASRPVDFPTPLGAMNGSPAVEIGIGLDYGCARTGAGALWCWGYNGYGQFGNGDVNDSPTVSPIWILSISTL
jgi:alpha-tubulin suppressor-like RCC1 family protein